MCQNCRGLGIIGTSVGSNHFRGRDYDCDVCHGTGYIELFIGNGEVSQKHFAQQPQAVNPSGNAEDGTEA